MSSLNLNPNPTIMIVEAGIFLLNFVAVKKLFLDPFLKVQDQRFRLTEGSQHEAEKIQKDNHSKAELIHQRLSGAANESRVQRDKTIASANGQRDEVISKASAEASSIIENMRQELSRELASERGKIPQLVQTLTRDFVQKLVAV
jgi:F0F1-type ATP synthase membrane subunit b/b'